MGLSIKCCNVAVVRIWDLVERTWVRILLLPFRSLDNFVHSLLQLTRLYQRVPGSTVRSDSSDGIIRMNNFHATMGEFQRVIQKLCPRGRHVLPVLLLMCICCSQHLFS